jgi:hypothetical protein
MRFFLPAISFLISFLVPLSVSGAEAGREPVDLVVVTAIREEGFNHSKLMGNLSYLTEVIGPRLTASPQMRMAAAWALGTFKVMGLANVHAEPFEFGRGWSFSRSGVHMISPQAMPLAALPQAWSPGTNGPVKGEVVKVLLRSEADFDAFRGKLKGKIVFLDEIGDIPDFRKEPISRYSAEDLKDLRNFVIPDGLPPEWKEEYAKKRKFLKPLMNFLSSEGALATVEESDRGYGLIRVMGYTYLPGDTPKIPRLVMAAENYNHILRLVASGRPVTLELDVAASFNDEDSKGYNVIAEIPGTGKADEVVMAGAHYDSWHAGTGASDNGAGVAIVMEAMRILKQLDVKPKRTIRAALWAGEEQGLMGSTAYVSAHFAARPEPRDAWQKQLPPDLRDPTWPVKLRPDHKKLSVYFNVDNGSGKIRGIYSEDNEALKPIFDAWFEPFHDLGADTNTLRGTGGTDHLSFDDVGLPGFQFIQDKLDYRSRLHHTNMDTIDHVQPDDMKQAAIILASFLYHAAMRDEMLPRKPMPRAPDKRP